MRKTTRLLFETCKRGGDRPKFALVYDHDDGTAPEVVYCDWLFAASQLFLNVALFLTSALLATALIWMVEKTFYQGDGPKLHEPRAQILEKGEVENGI